MGPRVWRTLASATQALWPTFSNHQIYQLQPAETESAPNVIRLLSAETEHPPKVSIYAHSAPKPKPKFGRPLFDSLSKIENWEPAYQICYCLLSSRQQRKMWNSCCNLRLQTSSLTIYGFRNNPGFNAVDYRYVEYCSNVFIEKLLKTKRWRTEVAFDWSVVLHPAKCRWSGDWQMASSP